MTAPQYVRNLLEDNWQSSITGRPHDVGELDTDSQSGKVKIVYESDDEWRSMDLSNFDYLTIRDGGISNITPTSFGWLNEDRTARVTVDIRSKGWPTEDRPGRIALYGERGAGDLDPNESPRYGGLAGEVERVLKEPRDGDQEFSLISTPEINDLSGQMGGQIWRGTVTAVFESRSTEINTQP